MKAKSCESCFMPLDAAHGQAGAEKYCNLCFQNGELCYKGSDVKEFQKICYENMVKSGMNKWKAKFFAWIIQFAPRWKKK